MYAHFCAIQLYTHTHAHTHTPHARAQWRKWKQLVIWSTTSSLVYQQENDVFPGSRFSGNYFLVKHCKKKFISCSLWSIILCLFGRTRNFGAWVWRNLFIFHASASVCSEGKKNRIWKFENPWMFWNSRTGFCVCMVVSINWFSFLPLLPSVDSAVSGAGVLGDLFSFVSSPASNAGLLYSLDCKVQHRRKEWDIDLSFLCLFFWIRRPAEHSKRDGQILHSLCLCLSSLSMSLCQKDTWTHAGKEEQRDR